MSGHHCTTFTGSKGGFKINQHEWGAGIKGFFTIYGDWNGRGISHILRHKSGWFQIFYIVTSTLHPKGKESVLHFILVWDGVVGGLSLLIKTKMGMKGHYQSIFLHMEAWPTHGICDVSSSVEEASECGDIIYLHTLYFYFLQKT